MTMLRFSFKKLLLANYLFAAFILAAALFFIRDIINISFSKEKPHLTVKEAETANKSAPQKKGIMHYASILEKNPFGPPMKLRPIGLVKDVEEKDTIPSDLLLIGTVVGPKNLSYAIFEDKSKSTPHKQEVFAYRENVYNYGILTRIDKESIELTQGSEKYIIPFVEKKNGTKKLQVKSINSSQKSFVKKLGDKQYLLDRKKLLQSLNNPEHILTDARLLPNIQNGKQKGFKVSEVKPKGLYASIGLKNGDILQRINGLEISNPEVAIQAISAVRGMNSIELDIIRNGKKMSINYQIK